MTSAPILLVGAGGMAKEYLRVLRHLEMDVQVMGRGAHSASTFFDDTGVRVGTGPLTSQLDDLSGEVSTAIVAVNAQNLATTTAPD